MASSMEDPASAFTAHTSVQAFSVSPPVFLTRHFPPPGSSDTSRPPAPAFLATGAIVFDRSLPNTDFPPRLAGAGAQHEASTPNPNPDSPRPKSETPRVLLVQRAAHDTMPLRWETPGGGCDDDDTSILHSCARELFEEAGLRATAVGPLVRVGFVSDSEGVRGDGPRSEVTAVKEKGHEWGEGMGGDFFRTRRGKLVCKFYFVAMVPEERVAEVMVDPKEHIGYVWVTEEEVRQKKVHGEGGTDLEFTTQAQWEVILTAFKLWHA
ncbi:NUDIX hydrolase domain-like protein [Lasiosphaeria miniovina]|uniref:NUDIX hydrolase domain-like protein n=1 Tax=Lasiosphaeria miniovina TaxID=1954250 RepID=A0AA40DV59_9PEZI|nr:NUDIX hydrolase domain-like protein [Lasiosphaeria miniovina]KAK0717544.1 NUDIX hydrolase domain-like protein [Lasiosphaeria miniovina]